MGLRNGARSARKFFLTPSALRSGQTPPPTAQQPPHLSRKPRKVFILTGRPPLVQQRDVRILAQLIERHIGLAQRLGAQAAGQVARSNKLVQHAHGQVGHALLHRVALLARKPPQRLQQPGQQIARAGVYAQ